MNEWISVKFAVPHDERYVLVQSSYEWTMSNGDKRCQRVIHIASRIVFKNGHVKWKSQSGGYISTHKSQTKITHWMPLPDLPK